MSQPNTLNGMTAKEMIRLAKKFKGWQRQGKAQDLWMGDDYAFSPQGFSKSAQKRSDEALAFCEAAPDFILALTESAVESAIAKVAERKLP